jgi:chromosome segregation ATPase
MSISIDTVTDAIIGKLDAENKALEAEVERLERYLFAARAQVNELEVQQRQADREREVFSTEVGRLAHALAAMEGQCDEARAEAERLRRALRAMLSAYEGVYDMAVPFVHQSEDAKQADALARAALEEA